ncbi:DUF1840 domain-containing protein [Sulfurisoma sediminicola]|uniref:Uncharacterized protein DUF1840 n=1 Tax=Sulfurisoma sediminicola TaxID=1381557 RepID=A0A497XL76_9PROT|nr:DUF1840 domain-containing protein [Sulfurisoma sediminicola]RLJ68150.1 uncharacterized protein DUF1840 [Sulfurisoma sediminicola]
MITFQSDASGDVMMFDEVAHRMMEIMGKERTVRGVVTVEQMPECIARLKAAIAEDRAKAHGKPQGEEEEETGVAARVSLAQRALPLVELLERSLQREKPVLWGV